MKRLLCAAVLISMLFAAVSCTTVADPPAPEITEEDLYAVDVQEDAWPVIEGPAAFLPYFSAAAARMLDVSEEDAKRRVLCTITDFAYSDLINRSADVIFCFLPNEQQVRLADHEGVTLACYPVLNEAFVFFVSASNPVESLSAEQLRDIYTGAVTNWSEVGGDDEAILPFRRSQGSSDAAGLERFIAREPFLVTPPARLREGFMGESAEVTATFDASAGAIGCGYLHSVQQQYPGMALKILKVDGIEASEDNIQSGVYPFVSQACAIIRGGEEETPAGQFAQWCAWPLGQDLAAEKGYVSNMKRTEAKPAVQDETDPLGNTPENGWAIAQSASQAQTGDLRKNSLQIETITLADTERLHALAIQISGLKDKNVEAAVNARIRAAVEAFSDDAYLPDAQGICIAQDRGLKSEEYAYKYIHAMVTANSGNVLSVCITCNASYALPKTAGASEPAFFTACETLNLDLNSGKDIPITAFVTEESTALAYLNALTAQYLLDNADEVYRDEDYAGHREGIGETDVLVTHFPGLAKDQKYYVDDSEGMLYLVLDAETPWAVTGRDFACLPLDPKDRAAFYSFVTPHSIFE